MKNVFLALALCFSLIAQSQKTGLSTFFSFGIDYRQYPTDIEDVQRGPLPSDNGLPDDDGRFWQVVSIYSSYGLGFKNNWILSATIYSRYNLLHRLEGVRYPNPPYNNVKEKKTFKFDSFIDIEKKFPLKKDKERYLLLTGGIGFTNINSGFDITLTDTTETGPFPAKHYKGTLLHFGPRISLGYQYQKIKASVNAFIIEDPTLSNLTSLWLGASISYEITRKRGKQ